MQPESLSPTQRSVDFVGPFFFTRFRFQLPNYPYTVPGFHVLGPDRTPCLFVKHTPPKRKSEFVVYTGESESQPLLTLWTRKGAGTRAHIEVFDMVMKELLVIMRKRRLRSMLWNSWEVLDQGYAPLGRVSEVGLPVIRRFAPKGPLIHTIEMDGMKAATVSKDTSGVVPEFDLDLSSGVGHIDTRVALACAILVVAIETQRDIVMGEYRIR
jgi:hypothetical protein